VVVFTAEELEEEVTVVRDMIGIKRGRRIWKLSVRVGLD